MAQPRKLFLRPQVHLSRRAGPPDVQMMKRNRRLDHRLEKQLLLWTSFVHPTLFPRIVRSVEFARVVKVDPGDVLDRISRDMRVRVGDFRFSSHYDLRLNRAAITFAAVAPAPVAPLIVGAIGFETSPIANTIGTLVSCSLFTAA